MAKLRYNDVDYDTDDEFSGRDFTGRTLTSFDLSGRVIYATVFAQEEPDTLIFDALVNGATFIRCNLTNVLMPPGNVLVDCITTRCATMNDGRVWELDEKDKPIRLTAEKHWRIMGASIDPADIPAEKIVLTPHETLETKLAELQAAKEALFQ